MEIQLQTKNVTCCREFFRQTKVFQENCECIVSDVNEDIGRIVWSGAQLCLKSKDITQFGVSVSGIAEISVLYLNDNCDRIICMSFSKEFSADFELPSVDPETQAHISLSCMGVQTRSVNPRKLASQLTIRAELRCWKEEVLNFATGVESPEDYAVETKEANAEFCVSSQICEKSFVVSEQLPFDAEGESEGQIFFPQVKLSCNDCQMIGGKALVKGFAVFSFLYLRGQRADPTNTEQSIPFTFLLDASDEGSRLGQMILQPTAVYASLSDAINGGRVIELEIHALAQAVFERTERVSYLSDAYSTRYPLQTFTQSLLLDVEEAVQTVSAESLERVELESRDVQILSGFASLISYSWKDGKVSASISAAILMRSEDGTLSSVHKLLSLEAEVPGDGTVLNEAFLQKFSAELEENTLILAASVSFSMGQTEKVECNPLVRAELFEDGAYDLASRPSFTAVNRRGRELWTLAKDYHSSVKAIEELNERYPMPNGILLIPRV